MKIFQRFFDFYVSSSIHVALAVYALVKITEFYIGVPPNKKLNCTIFFGTIVGYNFIKLNGYQLKNFIEVKILSLISFGLTIFFGWQLNLRTILLFIPFGLLTYLYTSPFLSLRNIPSIKIIVVATVWAGITVILPFFDANSHSNPTIILTFIQRFLIVIALTLPFDIRDFHQDKRQLQTLPQILGVARTKKIGFILLAIVMLIEFFTTPNQIFKSIFIIVFLLLLMLLQKASTRQSKYYSSFWVEGIPILWWMLLNIVNM